MVNKASRSKNSILNLVTGISGQFVIIVLGFATRTVFISTLGKSYLGINGLFSDVLTMLSLTELGLDTAINFKLYKPLAEDDQPRIRALMKFYRTAYRVVGVTILGLGLCLIPILPYLIEDYESLAALDINAVLIFILYLLQSVSSYLFFASQSAIVRADQREYLLNVVGYVVTLALNVSQILILLILKSFVVYTAVTLLFNIVQNMVNAFVARCNYPQAFIKSADRLEKQEILGIFKDLGALFIYKVNDVILMATDNLVLSTFLGLGIVGLYSNYLMFYGAIRGILNRFYSAIKASMGNLFVVDDVAKKYKFFEIMNFFSVILYGTACVGITVCADEMITVWIGPDYVIKQPLAILVGIETLFLGLRLNLGQIRNVSGVFRQMWFRPVIASVLNIVISIVLVNICGIYGVLIGTIASTIFANLAIDPYIIHKYSFNGYKSVFVYYKKNFVYLIILLSVCAIDIWICSWFYIGYGWGSLLVHVFIVLITVPGTFVLLCWRTEECRYIVNLIGIALKKL